MFFRQKLPESEVERYSVAEFLQMVSLISDENDSHSPGRSLRYNELNKLQKKFLNEEARFVEGEFWNQLFAFGGGTDNLSTYFNLDTELKQHHGEFFAVCIDDLMDYPFNGISEKMHQDEVAERERNHFRKDEGILPVVLIGRICGAIRYDLRNDDSMYGIEHDQEYLYMSRGIFRKIKGHMFHQGRFSDEGEGVLCHRKTTCFFGGEIRHCGDFGFFPELHSHAWSIARRVTLVVGNDAVTRIFRCNMYPFQQRSMFGNRRARRNVIESVTKAFASLQAEPLKI